MNGYNNEKLIINDFHNLKRREILLLNLDGKGTKIFNKIFKSRSWNFWINSSGKNDPPPDYYSDKFKLMMDVMRIDDHSFINKKGKICNPHNQRESILRKELEKKNNQIKEASLAGRLYINPYTKGEDHNYLLYKDNFIRVISNHINKISMYNANHKDYKLIFFVCDESSPYIENICSDFQKFTKAGQEKDVNPHLWWVDNNMLKTMKDSNVDYLIWYTPYKWFNSVPKVVLPRAIVFDISKLDYSKLLDYDINKMESLETQISV